MQVWRTAGSYEPERGTVLSQLGTVLSQLATLVRSRAIDSLRRRKALRGELEDNVDEAINLSDSRVCPESASMAVGRSRIVREAIDQLSPRYLHVKAGKTGVLDYVFERYLTEAEPLGMSFIDWVESDAYDPAAIKADFRAQWWGSLLTEKLIRRE